MSENELGRLWWKHAALLSHGHMYTCVSLHMGTDITSSFVLVGMVLGLTFLLL